MNHSWNSNSVSLGFSPWIGVAQQLGKKMPLQSWHYFTPKSDLSQNPELVLMQSGASVQALQVQTSPAWDSKSAQQQGNWWAP